MNSALGNQQFSRRALMATVGAYPRRGMTEWDYEKGNLDDATKQYAVEAGRLVKQAGGRMHFFCVGRVLEQPEMEWLKQIAADHAVGNHTYDHVYVLATKR